MAKFKDRQKGTRGRKPVVLPFLGATFNHDLDKWEGPTDTVDLRAISPDEYTEIVKGARDFAIANGLAEPKFGDELYERGIMLHTLAAACVDHDAEKDDPEPAKYFESWQEIHESKDLIPEIISFLFQHQRIWQDEVSPLRKDLSEAEYINLIAYSARGDFDFFLSLRPATQLSFLRTSANQLSTLIKVISPSISPSEPPESTP